MKLLIICPSLPYPVKTGGDQAVFNMITELQKMNEIHFLFPVKRRLEKTIYEYINSLNAGDWSNVILHPFYQIRDWKYKLSKLGLRLYNSYNNRCNSSENINIASQHFTPQYIKFIKDKIESIQPDIIQTEFFEELELVYMFPKEISKVFVQHEIHYVVKGQRLPVNINPMLHYQYQHSICDEIMAMNQYDGILTLTEDDREKLLLDGVTSKIFSSPVGIPAPKIRNKCQFSNKLIFVGPSGHTPNRDGLLWFLSNVWPIINSTHSEVTLNIVGHWDKSISQNIIKSYKGVSFLGFVPSLSDAYDGSIAIVPILSGSGMRIKIVDAVNMGSPFISTNIGAEGLLYKDGVDCFIADDPQEFSSKLITLIESEELRHKFYNNSAMTRDRYYSMEVLAKKRMEFYNEIIKTK